MSTTHTTNGTITLSSFAELGAYADTLELREENIPSAETELGFQVLLAPEPLLSSRRSSRSSPA
jgi:hypothetical protein